MLLNFTKKKRKKNPDIEKRLEVKSQSSGNGSDLVGKDKLNQTNIKMTETELEKKAREEAEAKAAEEAQAKSKDVEQKALEILSADMKSLSEKYDSVQKENASLKEVVEKMAEDVGKITEAMKKPIHGSLGNQLGDAAVKNNAERKSVDPLALI